MGSGAGKDKKDPETEINSARNRIFLDEGVGIEQSAISRKWTSKMSIFRNMESMKQDQSPENRRFSHFFNKQDLNDNDSIIYSSEQDYSNSSFENRQQSHSVQSKKQNQFDLKKAILNPNILAEKESQLPQKLSDSDIEESSDEEQRRRQLTYNQYNKLSDEDSGQEEQSENIKKIKALIEQIKEDQTNTSIDSTNDLNLIESLDLDDIYKGLSNQFMSPILGEPNFSKNQSHQNQFQLKRLYLRSRLSNDKPIVGLEKKIKFDAKQEEFYDIFEQPEGEDNESESSSQKQPIKQSQQQIQKQKEQLTPQDFLEEIGIAVVCKKGNKREGPHMNDYFIYNDSVRKHIIQSDRLLNGHGEYGQYVTNIAYRLLFNSLIREPIFYTNPTKALKRVMQKLQQMVKEYFDKKRGLQPQNCILSGCVITIVIQRDSKLIFGHIGDNRATIYKELHNISKQKKIIAEQTPMHCPLDPTEKARIFIQGGEVRKNAQLEEHVYVRGRLYPQLHVTRSIGDLIGHVIGVTSDPFVKEYDLTVFDTFLVLSSSPTFTYMEQDEIMNHLTGFTLRNIRQACDSLYKRAKSSWIVSEGVFEDMVIIMIWLGPLREKK